MRLGCVARRAMRGIPTRGRAAHKSVSKIRYVWVSLKRASLRRAAKLATDRRQELDKNWGDN